MKKNEKNEEIETLEETKKVEEPKKKSPMPLIISLILILLALAGGYYLGNENILKLRKEEPKVEEKEESKKDTKAEEEAKPEEEIKKEEPKIEAIKIYDYTGSEEIADTSHGVIVKSYDENCGGYTITYNGKEIVNNIVKNEGVTCRGISLAYLVGDVIVTYSHGSDVDGSYSIIDLEGHGIKNGQTDALRSLLNKTSEENEYRSIRQDANPVNAIGNTIYITSTTHVDCEELNKMEHTSDMTKKANEMIAVRTVAIDYLGSGQFSEPKIVEEVPASTICW